MLCTLPVCVGDGYYISRKVPVGFLAKTSISCRVQIQIRSRTYDRPNQSETLHEHFAKLRKADTLQGVLRESGGHLRPNGVGLHVGIKHPERSGPWFRDISDL